MGTYTATFINNYEYENTFSDFLSEIGLIIRIPYSTEHETSLKLDLERSYQGTYAGYYNTTYEFTYSEWKHYAVYFKPNNGVRLTGHKHCQRKTSGNSWVDSDNLSKLDEPFEFVYPNEGLEDLSINDPSYVNQDTNQEDMTYDGYGYMYLGEQKVEKYAIKAISTKSTTGNDSSYAKTSLYYDKSIETHQFVGETDYLQLLIFGNDENVKQIYYSFTSDSKHKTFLFRKSNEEHVYTNMVAFDEKYDVNSLTYPKHFAYCTINSSGFSSSQIATDHWWNSKLYLATLSPVAYLNKDSYKTSSIKRLDSLDIDDEIEGDIRIRSILLYIDSGLHIYSSNIGRTLKYITDLSSTTTYLTYMVDVTKNLDANSVLNNLTCVNLDQIALYLEDKFENAMNEVTSYHTNFPDLSSYLELALKHPEYVASYAHRDLMLPRAHRWIQLVGRWDYDIVFLNNTATIAEYCNVVKYIDNNIESYGEIVRPWTTGQVRTTDYWYCKTSDGDKVVHISQMPSIVLNAVLSPICKPWAYVWLDVFPPEGSEDSIAFGRVRELNTAWNLINDTINNNLERKHIKHIQLSAGGEMDDVVETLHAYEKTISPFRIESWLVHGSRYEYDKDRQLNTTGRCAIALADVPNSDGRTGIGDDAFNQIHLRCKSWNDMFSSSDICYNIFSQSCFGLGIANLLVRNVSNNVLTSAYDVIDSSISENVFSMFLACGTHVGVTDVSFKAFLNVLENWPFYNSSTLAFNRKTIYAEKLCYMRMYEYFINNYDAIQSLLMDKDEYEMWEKTKQLILNDIKNNGEKYFVMYDWDNSSSQLKASDNFFFPDVTISREDTGDENILDDEYVSELLKKKCYINGGFINLWKYYVGQNNVRDVKLRVNLANASGKAAIYRTFSAQTDGFREKVSMIRTTISNVCINLPNATIFPGISKPTTVLQILAIKDTIKTYACYSTEWDEIEHEYDSSVLNANDHTVFEIYSQCCQVQYWIDETLDGTDIDMTKFANDYFFNETTLNVEDSLTNECANLILTYQNIFGEIDYINNYKYMPVMKPRTYCAGKFKTQNVRFLTNPNHIMHSRLTDDGDLKALSEISNKS